MVHFFTALGLTPGAHSPRVLRARFEERRRQLLEDLNDPRLAGLARKQLDRLHLAYRALSSDAARAATIALPARGTEDRAAELRLLIESSLEDGLLRHSRRAALLAEGRRLGFSEFHVHLLIAQVQVCGRACHPLFDLRASGALETAKRTAARLAAAAVLGLAFFLVAVRWLGN